jgi:hypothetical protein
MLSMDVWLPLQSKVAFNLANIVALLSYFHR